MFILQLENRDFVPFNFSALDEAAPRKKLREVDPLDNLVLDNRKAQKSPGATSRMTEKVAHESELLDEEKDSANEASHDEKDAVEYSKGGTLDDSSQLSGTPWFKTPHKYSPDLVKM